MRTWAIFNCLGNVAGGKTASKCQWLLSGSLKLRHQAPIDRFTCPTKFTRGGSVEQNRVDAGIGPSPDLFGDASGFNVAVDLRLIAFGLALGLSTKGSNEKRDKDSIQADELPAS